MFGWIKNIFENIKTLNVRVDEYKSDSIIQSLPVVAYVNKAKGLIENKEFEQIDASSERLCPNCGSKMVKNSSSIHNEIKVDDCYSCGGKFLDRGELVKIRAEYDTVEQRDEDILRYVYKEVGQELAELDKVHSEINPHRTYVRKIFYKLTGL